MSRAKQKTTTAERATPARLTTLAFAERLDDIADRIEIVTMAIVGLDAGPLETFVREIGAQIRAVSREIHPKIAEAV